MVININETNEQLYKDFFTEAYKFAKKLEEDDPNFFETTNEASQERFESLWQYFKYLPKLADADPTYYTKLPLDEPTVDINGNTREIEVPSQVTKCLSIQNDQIAETVIFTVDRFHDHMDLMNANILIQWTAQDSNGDIITRATEIENPTRDIDLIPGKIRFGWPLTSEITQYPGKIEFSAVFYIEKTIVNQKTGKEENLIVYRFNTLPATATIIEALQPELNSAEQIDRPSSLFSKAVTASSYGPGFFVPQVPSFTLDGLDLDAFGSLTNDTLILKAQATVGDNGAIEYIWYYKPVNAAAFQRISDTNGKYVINNEVLETTVIKEVKDINFRDNYYDMNGNPITSQDIKRMIEDARKDETDENPYVGVTVKEKYTTLTIVPEKDLSEGLDPSVTGVYKVVATNTKADANGTDRTSAAQDSKECTLRSPEDLSFGDTEGTSLFFSQIRESGLDAGLQEDGKSAYAYKWQRKTALTDEFADAIYDTDKTYTDKILKIAAQDEIAGWYTPYVKASLNREEKETGEEVIAPIWRLLKDPITFYLVSDDTTIVSNSTTGTAINKDDAAYSSTVAVNNGDDLTLAIKVKVGDTVTTLSEAFKDPLISDNYTCRWYENVADQPEQNLIVDNETVKEIDTTTGKIVFKNLVMLPNKFRTICCEVVNTLNGNSSSKATYSFTLV